MRNKPIKIVRLDAKGRIVLGKLAKEANNFATNQKENNSLANVS